MAKLKQTENIVKIVLEENKDAREDDFVLITEVYYRLIPNISKISFSVVMLGHKELGLPSFETITRTRRKLQEKYSYLKPSKKIQDIRKKEQLEYISYSHNLL